MRLTFCPRESEALALVGIGQWPHRAEPELLGQVAGCASCAEAIDVASALAEIEEGEARRPLPDAAAVWQRAQWQARHDAVRRAARPVLTVQAVLAIAIVALMAAAVTWLVRIDAPAGPRAALGRLSAALSEAFGPAVVAVTDVVRLEFPSGPVVLIGGAVGLGLVILVVAVGLAALADVQTVPSPRRDSPKSRA
jgi:hypothetical protein